MYQRFVARLAATPGLYVIGPDMAAVYSDTELTGEQIALYLNVRGVVQASVDSDGQMVSLDLRFTDAASDGAETEQHFTAPMADLAAIENDVMSSVLAALGAPQPAAEPPIP
jgi:TolB-like protein